MSVRELVPPDTRLAHEAMSALRPAYVDEAMFVFPGSKQGKPLSHLRLHLVFDDKGQLAEQQLIEMPAKKVLGRAVFSASYEAASRAS